MFQIETVYSREERERERERGREGGREGEGGGGADGIRWVDSVICNNGLYIKHIFASTPGPSIFIPKCSPSQPSHSEKQENEINTY